jgi:hypothetical protein
MRATADAGCDLPWAGQPRVETLASRQQQRRSAVGHALILRARAISGPTAKRATKSNALTAACHLLYMKGGARCAPRASPRLHTTYLPAPHILGGQLEYVLDIILKPLGAGFRKYQATSWGYSDAVSWRQYSATG